MEKLDKDLYSLNEAFTIVSHLPKWSDREKFSKVTQQLKEEYEILELPAGKSKRYFITKAMLEQLIEDIQNDYIRRYSAYKVERPETKATTTNKSNS